MELIFDPEAWKDYLYWQDQDKKTLRRINQLIKDIYRSPYEGIGKPEPLKGRPCWSRRIDNYNRLIYDISDGNLRIIACRDHYKD